MVVNTRINQEQEIRFYNEQDCLLFWANVAEFSDFAVLYHAVMGRTPEQQDYNNLRVDQNPELEGEFWVVCQKTRVYQISGTRSLPLGLVLAKRIKMHVPNYAYPG